MIKLHQYKNNKFLKNFFTLFTGSIIAQGIVLLSIPILTRLFTKEIFGIYALFISTIFLLKPLVTLCFELAIVLPKRDKDAINVFVFSLILIFSTSLFICAIIFVFHDYIISTLHISEISFLIYFVPLSVFFLGNITVLNYWNNREDLFKNISIGNVSKSVTMSSAQLITGFSPLNYIGLVPGMILGQFINLMILVKLSFVTIKKNAQHISFKRMLFLASKYRDIPLYNTVLTFTNSLSNELPVLLITSYFGLEVAGIYGLALKVSKTPLGLVGQSISPVFFNQATKIYNENNNIFKFTKKAYKNLLLTALLIALPLFFISFYLDFIFGEDWIEVGIYVRVLIPWLIVMFLNSPISSLVSILNKQKTILYYDVLLLISRFIALYIGYSIYNDILISLILFSGVGVIFNLIILFYFLKITKDSINKLDKVYK